MLFYQCTFEKCTFVHYVEQMFGVDYRFRKYVTGDVVRCGVSWQDTFTFYARRLGQNVENDFRNFATTLDTSTDDKSILVSCDEVVQKIDDLFHSNPYGLLKQVPDFVDEEDDGV